MMSEEKAIEYMRMILRDSKMSDTEKALGYVYATEALETLIEASQKKEDTISECRNRLEEKQLMINKLEMIAGLALKRGPLEISKKTFIELDNMIKIEQTENVMNDSYIFRAV